MWRDKRGYNRGVPTEAKPLQDERALVQQARQGDPNAFGLLYDQYIDRIYRFVYYRVSDGPLAEDLTSRIFLKAWENLPSYRDRGLSFGTWLFSIARNSVIDHYRTAKTEQALEDAGALMDFSADPEEVLTEALRAERLASALQTLTDEQREVLVLKFIEGYSTEEVAELMEKKPGAIRALQMRGLQALERVLGEDEPW